MKNSPEKTFINITEAASISGKSIQTIRRAIKAKKIQARRQKTPQGFNYFVSQESLTSCFRIKIPTQLRQIPVEENLDTRAGGQVDNQQEMTQPVAEAGAEVVGGGHISELKENVKSLMGQYHRERDQMGSIMKDFQDRLMVMENQVRFLAAPKKKWYQLWK